MNEQTDRRDPQHKGMQRSLKPSEIAPPEVAQELLAIAQNLRQIGRENPLIACEITAAARLIEIKLMNGSVGLVSLHQAAMRALDGIGNG